MAAVASDVCIAEGDLENDVLRLFRAYKKAMENGLLPRGITSVEKSYDLKSASHKDLFVATDGSPSPSAFASYELLMNSYKEANKAAYKSYSFEGKPDILKAFVAMMGSDIPKFTAEIFPEEASHEELEGIRENLVDKVEALFLEVKEIVRRETGFEGSQPEVSDFVAITLQSDDKPTLFVFAHAVLCLIVGYFAVEEMMVNDGSSAGDTAAPVEAAAAPKTSSAGDTAVSDKSSVDAVAKPAEVPAENHSKPFCYDLYLYVAYKYHLIRKADYFALRSRQIRHYFTENIGKSVILLSYAYRSKIQENLAGALSLINVNLPVHNTVKYIRDLVNIFSINDPSFVYEYMVLLGFISEVTLEIYRRNKETDPYEGYINAACKYFRECGMLNIEEMLRRDNYITLHDFANHLAKSWEPMEGLVEVAQQSLGIPSSGELKLVASHLPNETSNDRDSSEGPKPEGGAAEGRSGPEGQENGSLDKVAKCPKEEESASDEESELKDEGVKDDESRKPGEDGPASEEEDDESEAQLGGAVGSEERSNPEGKEDVSCWKPKPKGKKSKNKKKKGRR